MIQGSLNTIPHIRRPTEIETSASEKGRPMPDDDIPVLVSEEAQRAAGGRQPSDPPNDASSVYDLGVAPTALLPSVTAGQPESTMDSDASQPPTAESTVTAGTLAQLQADVAALGAEIPRLNGVIDRLHADNERLRRGESAALLQPLFRDLIKMSDDWLARAKVWENKEDSTASVKDVAKACRETAEDAQLILERHGIEAFVPHIGEPFDRRLHRAVGKKASAEPALDGCIAAIRRTGYHQGERVLRHAEVIVHRCEPSPPTLPTPQLSTDGTATG